MHAKFIFVSGGVISGVGKGTTTAAIAYLLKSRGFKVAPIKCDPYLNYDAGTMNPIVHGETFVTEDGLETDQDLGHYERFLNENLSKFNYLTSGQVYLSVIQKERNLSYGGKCVETIPHVPEEINRRILKLVGKTKADFIIIEIGGTVGEYQNMMYLEAAKYLQYKYPDNVINIHVAYLPIPKSLGEIKSKPVQISVMLLNQRGINPDIIICRAEKPIDNFRKEKIALFCNVSKKDIFSNPDVKSIYELPRVLENQKITKRILDKFHMTLRPEDKNITTLWNKLLKNIEESKKSVKIAIVGKYFRSGDFSLEDSYICVLEALKQACAYHRVKPEIIWIDSYDIEKKGTSQLNGFQGIIIPQGWGSRATEGKILSTEFARTHNVSYLGLCYGMQIACIEFARHVCNLDNANSQEINPKTPHPIIHIMPDQKEYLRKKQYGGTIRLGSWPCKIVKNTLLSTIYKNPQKNIEERHRHRYEFNQKYRKMFEEKGMVFSGISPDGKLIEAIELKNHKFFLGTQFHPELKSRFLSIHPIFIAFIQSCLK